MKRKVAAMGRRSGEFSWSMSEKNGRKGIYQGTETTKRPSVPDSCSQRCGFGIPQMLMGEQTLVFRGCKKHTERC